MSSDLYSFKELWRHYRTCRRNKRVADRWDNDDLHNLQTRVHGSDFEAVDESSLMIDPSSAQAR